MREYGALFGYSETEISLETNLEKMSKEEVNTRWQSSMSEFFEIPQVSSGFEKFHLKRVQEETKRFRSCLAG